MIGTKDLEFKDYLKNERNIQCEKTSVGAIEFLTTIGTTKGQFQGLIDAVGNKCSSLGKIDKMKIKDNWVFGRLRVLPRDAAKTTGELVELKQEIIVGRVSAQMLVPYPPGIPAFLPGVEITKDMLEIINSAINKGGIHQVHGIFEENEKYYCKVLTKKEANKLINKEFESLPEFKIKVSSND